MRADRPWRLTSLPASASELFARTNRIAYPPRRPRKVYFVSGVRPGSPHAEYIHRHTHLVCHCPDRGHHLFILRPDLYEEQRAHTNYDSWEVSSIHAWRGTDWEFVERWLAHLRGERPCPVRNQPYPKDDE